MGPLVRKNVGTAVGCEVGRSRDGTDVGPARGNPLGPVDGSEVVSSLGKADGAGEDPTTV